MADGRLVMFPIVAVIVAGAARSLPTAPAPTASPKVDLASVAQGGAALGRVVEGRPGGERGGRPAHLSTPTLTAHGCTVDFQSAWYRTSVRAA